MAKKYNYRKIFTFDGQRYDIKADTEEELYTKVANKKRDLEEGKVRMSGSMTVRSWVNECINIYKSDVDPDYRSQMMGRLNKHLCAKLGTRAIRSIRPVELQSILSSQSGMSESHIRKLSQEICFVFNKAYQNHLIPTDPSDDLVRPKGYKNTRRSLTDHERTHFLKVCEQDPRFVYFLLMLYCGCRAKEARNVQGLDIQTIDDVHVLHIRGTKSARADRFVPIPDQLYVKIKDTPKFEYVALTQYGTPFNETSYHRLTERLRREMNLSMGCRTFRNQLVAPFPLAADFVPYMLRHTYCTDLQKKGVDVRTAQYLMGHSDISITANIYTHVDMDQIKTAAGLINGNSGNVSTMISTFKCI